MGFDLNVILKKEKKRTKRLIHIIVADVKTLKGISFHGIFNGNYNVFLKNKFRRPSSHTNVFGLSRMRTTTNTNIKTVFRKQYPSSTLGSTRKNRCVSSCIFDCYGLLNAESKIVDPRTTLVTRPTVNPRRSFVCLSPSLTATAFTM